MNVKKCKKKKKKKGTKSHSGIIVLESLPNRERPDKCREQNGAFTHSSKFTEHQRIYSGGNVTLWKL